MNRPKTVSDVRNMSGTEIANWLIDMVNMADRIKELEQKLEEQKSKEIKDFCLLIGCSGMNKSCPGNPHCSIVQKVFPPPENTND